MCALVTFFANPLFSQTICNQQGNLVIFSGYDGGELRINVDVNIPNLRIGVSTYEFTRVIISGTYAGNVISVHYAGVNSNNNNCNVQAPYTASVSGAPNAAVVILNSPPATLITPNGRATIDYSYSCDTSANQTANTPDQLVHYFMTTLGGTLYSHFTGYSCWPSQPIAISSGGNCCILPQQLPTGLASGVTVSTDLKLRVADNLLQAEIPAAAIGKTIQVSVYDVQGRTIQAVTMNAGSSLVSVPIQNLTSQLVLVQIYWGEGMANGKLFISQ